MRIFKTKIFSKFAKNEKDNLSDDELETAKDIAAGWLNADANQIKFSLVEGELKEIKHEKKSQ